MELSLHLLGQGTRHAGMEVPGVYMVPCDLGQECSFALLHKGTNTTQ